MGVGYKGISGGTLYLPHEILAPGEKYLYCDLCFNLVVCEDNIIYML